MADLIKQEQQTRLIDAMLAPFPQAALDREISSGWTLRQELHLLFVDAMKEPFAISATLDVLKAMLDAHYAELVVQGHELAGDWPSGAVH